MSPRLSLLLGLALLGVSGCWNKDSPSPADTPDPDSEARETGRDTNNDTDDTGAVDPDGDGDGFPASTDCDDSNPGISPGAEEIPYDGIDQDCDETDLTDADGDGFDAEGTGGSDCDDTDPEVHPGSDDPPGDGLDQDCDGRDPDRVEGELSLDEASAILEGRAYNEDWWGLLGWAVESEVDVNGDGFDDLLLGDPYGANANVWLLPGPVSGTIDVEAEALAGWRGEMFTDMAGYSLSSGGDVNGDGYGDFWVGTWGYYWSKYEYADRVYLVHGPSNAGITDLYRGSTAILYGEALGASVSGGEDIDGDGSPDLLVSESHYWGRSYLITERLAGEIQLEDVVEATFTAMSLAEHVGDVDGDGFNDVLTGYVLSEDEVRDSALLFRGPLEGDYSSEDADANLQAEVSDYGDPAVQAISGAGDVNGDGYADLLIGTPFYDSGGGVPDGRAYLCYGPVSGLQELANADARFTAESSKFDVDWLGYALDGGGDMDGDGLDDIAFSAPRTDTLEEIDEVPKVFLFYGAVSGTHPALDADLIFLGPLDWSDPGKALSLGGDVNADGLADLLIGSPNCQIYSETYKMETYPGCGHLFYGGGP